MYVPGGSIPTALELVYNGGSQYWPFVASGYATGENARSEICSSQADAETNNFGQSLSFYHAGGTIQFVYNFPAQLAPANGSPNPIFFLFKMP
jgi:hypothetical protein